jgi:hypothetical protein
VLSTSCVYSNIMEASYSVLRHVLSDADPARTALNFSLDRAILYAIALRQGVHYLLEMTWGYPANFNSKLLLLKESCYNGHYELTFSFHYSN